MPPVHSVEHKSSTCSSLMSCCTTERQGQTYTAATSSTRAYRENSKFLWLDPTRWVEKRSYKKEKVGLHDDTQRVANLMDEGLTQVAVCPQSSHLQMSSLPMLLVRGCQSAVSHDSCSIWHMCVLFSLDTREKSFF